MSKTESGHVGDKRCWMASAHVILNEGDDVVVRQCMKCGRVQKEERGERVMAWFVAPNANGSPISYAYPDPQNGFARNQREAFANWTEPQPLGIVSSIAERAWI